MTEARLEGVRFVIGGTFDFISTDAARAALVARGATIEASVGGRTHALIAGADADPAALQRARSLGKPILGKVGLERMLEGEWFARAVQLDGGLGPPSPVAGGAELKGKTVAASGKLEGHTIRGLTLELERRGAKLVKKPTRTTSLLLLGRDYKQDAILALEQGVPSITEEQLQKVFSGTPLSTYVGEGTEEGKSDPEAHVRALVEKHLPAIVAFAGDESQRFDETLSVTVHPDGRVAILLAELGGTPLETHARALLRAERFPVVERKCRVDTRFRIGPG